MQEGEIMNKSEQLFERAKKFIPGGVNSPVRAFQSVGLEPPFITRGEGAYLYDVDGKKYLDFVSSWGPMITGHGNEVILESLTEAMSSGLSFGAATEKEVELAEFICERIPSVEMLRLVNSGTEAVMSALRVARGYTKRDKIVKFAGCYHGHCDSMLVKAGSGALTQGQADSLGVPESVAKDTLIANYNDLESVTKLFQHNQGQIAAVILEPVAANMGVVCPVEGFLEGLREICTKEDAILIFDEVITGFRLGFGGAQAYFGVDADLVTYGKIMGGGLPVGAYGGKKELMSLVAPLGGVYQAGTLSGNPLAVTAGLTGLKILDSRPELFEKLDEMGKFLADGYRALGLQVQQIGSLVCPFFTEEPVVDYVSAQSANREKFARYFQFMLGKGVYLAPSQFEAMFLSTAHRKEELESVLQWTGEFLNQDSEN